jgi:hypothetical protein
MQVDFYSLDFPKFLMAAIDDEKKRHVCYMETCDHAEEMAVHVYGNTPHRLLDITRPNEPQEITKYRKSVYQPKTKSTTEKALGVLFKIFNPSLFTIKWLDQDNNGKMLEDYTLEYYPGYNSVLVYLQEVVLPKMIADPNGIIAIKPLNMTIPDTERVQPFAVMYGSKNIWHYTHENCLVFIRKYTDEVRRTDVSVFEWYDSKEIIRFEAYIQAPTSIVIQELEKYPHGCKGMPVWKLRGKPVALDNGEMMFKSFFDAAVPYWNDAIGHESDLKGAFQNHIHPLRYEYVEECMHRDGGQPCKGGTISYPDGKSKPCPSCNGSGFKQSANSPYKTILINKTKVGGLDDSNSFPVPAGFITVPTEPTKLLDEYVDKQHQKGLHALNMDILDKVGENQSGIAKVVDRGELYDFLSRISTIIFDVHLPNIYYYFNAMMFGVSSKAEPMDEKKLNKNLPTIVKPVQFDIASTFELITQLSEAKKAGLNQTFLGAVQHEIIEKKFPDPQTRQFMMLTMELDPIPDYTPEEVNMLASQGVYRQVDVVIHFQLPQLIARALTESNGFVKLDKQGKMKVLEGYANQIINETKVTLKAPEPVIPDGN